MAIMASALCPSVRAGVGGVVDDAVAMVEVDASAARAGVSGGNCVIYGLVFGSGSIALQLGVFVCLLQSGLPLLWFTLCPWHLDL